MIACFAPFGLSTSAFCKVGVVAEVGAISFGHLAQNFYFSKRILQIYLHISFFLRIFAASNKLGLL